MRKRVAFIGAASLLWLSTVRGAPRDPFSANLPTHQSAAPAARNLSAGEASVATITGSASYGFGIEVPPGRVGMQPSIGLSYSSQGALYGGIAAGWALSGFPTIEVDGTAGAGPRRYVSGGARLVAVTDDPVLYVGKNEWGSPVTYQATPYRAEYDGSFLRYGYVASINAWVVKAPSGVTRYFEKTDGVRWYLTREEDLFGNEVVYTWAAPSGGMEIQNIEYGANANAGLGHHARVTFVYDPVKTCSGATLPIGAAHDRGTVLGARKLTRIQTEVRDAPGGNYRVVRQVDLGYDLSAEACSVIYAAPMRYLTSITERAFSPSGVATTMPTITLGYGKKERTYTATKTVNGVSWPSAGMHGASPRTDVATIDLDGDGLLDQARSVTVQESLWGTQLNQPVDVTRCAISWRRGLPGGGFAILSQQFPLPTAKWKNGPHPSGSRETCTLYGQVFERDLKYGQCSRVGVNYLGYSYLDWNGDGGLDVLTSAWTSGGQSLHNELELRSGVAYFDDSEPYCDPDSIHGCCAGTSTPDPTAPGLCVCPNSGQTIPAGGSGYCPDLATYDGTTWTPGDPLPAEPPSLIPMWQPDYDHTGSGCPDTTASPELATTAGKFRWRVFPIVPRVTGDGIEVSRIQMDTIDAPWFLPPVGGDEHLGSGSYPLPSVPVLFDIDGDGFLDVVHPPDSGVGYDYPKPVMLNTATALRVHRGDGTGTFAPSVTWSKPTWLLPQGLEPTWTDPANPYFRLNTHVLSELRDFNGDGLADLVVSTSNGLAVAWNTGSGFSSSLQYLGVTGAVESMQINVDSYYMSGSPVATSGRRVYTRRIFDVDGDGRPDLVDFSTKADGTLNGSPIVRYNLGTTLLSGLGRDIAALAAARQSHTAQPMSAGGSATWRLESDVTDADVDGILDVSTWDGALARQTYLTDDFGTAAPRVLTTVNNGRGAVTTFTYASFNSATAQDVAPGAPMAWTSRTPLWVVTSMTVSPGGGQPAMKTEYRYGEPTFRQRWLTPTAHEPSRFVGFARVRTRSPVPTGAAGPKETLDQYFFRSEDGVAFLSQSVTYVTQNGALVPVAVSRPEYERRFMLGRAVAVDVTVRTHARQCLPLGQDLDTCWASGPGVDSVSTWTPWPSDTNPKLWVVTMQEQTSTSDWRDARRVETPGYDIYYNATAAPRTYLITPRAQRSWRVDPNGPGWIQTSYIEAPISTLGLPDEIRVWSAADQPPAKTRLTFDTTTGNLTHIQRPNQVAAGTTLETTLEYFNHEVFPSLFTNELGHQVTIERDPATGQVTRQVGPNAKFVPDCSTIGKNGQPICIYYLRFDEEKWTIDGFGRVLDHQAAFDSPSSGYALYPIERVSYDDANNKVTARVCTELGMCATSAWANYSTLSEVTTDGIGRVIQERQGRFAANGIDPITSYTYDGAGLLVEMRQPDPRADTGVQVTFSFQYDALGRVTRLHRPDGTTTQLAYGYDDAHGARLEKRTVIEGTSDGSGGTTDGLYDAYGRLLWVIEHDNPTAGALAQTHYRYDDADQLIEVEQLDPVGGQVTLLTHDWLGRRTQIDREGRVWKYRYDLEGNLTGEIAPMPAGASELLYTSTTTYDVLGRPVSHTPAARDMSEADRRLFAVGPTYFTYDEGNNGKGQLTTVRQPRWWDATLPDFLLVKYSYEANGLVTTETRSFNPNPSAAPYQGPIATQSVTRAYNAAGMPTQSTWDDGQSWFMSYDRRGLVKTVEYAPTQSGTRSVVADYGERALTGAPRTRTALGNQVRSWTYDNLGRITADVLEVGSVTRFDRTYAFTQAGDVKSIAGKNYDTSGAVWGDAAAVFTYDKTHRLLTASGPGAGADRYTAALTYSPSGNILSAKITGPASVKPRDVQYTYGATDPQAVDKLLVAGTSNAWALFEYDASGNMTERNTPLGLPMDMRWDGDDQLIQVSGAGSLYSESYHYDHTGQRVWAVSNGKVRFWFAESETELPVAGGAATYRYIGVAGEARAEKLGAAAPVLELHYSDALQNLVMVLSNTGAVEASFLYGAFGEVVKEYERQPGAGGHRKRFNGKEDDVASGLRYYGFRSYDPVTLRWVSSDPLLRMRPEVGQVEVGHLNLYAFSLGNPVRFYDPDGRKTEQEQLDDEPACQKKCEIVSDSFLNDNAKPSNGNLVYSHSRYVKLPNNRVLPYDFYVAPEVGSTDGTSTSKVGEDGGIPTGAIVGGEPDGEPDGQTDTEMGPLSLVRGIIKKVTGRTYNRDMMRAIDGFLIVSAAAGPLFAAGLRAGVGALFRGSAAGGLARGGAGVVRVGQAGEAAVRAAVDIGPKTAIQIAGRTRIPDGLTSTVLSEVKNVGSLSYTQQLRDFAAYAGQNGLRFDLWVRPTTQLSGPLADEVARGAINLRFIP